MARSRVMIWAGALGGLVAVSFVGATMFDGGVVGLATGGAGGCDGASVVTPEAVPTDVVALEPLARPVASASGPTQASLDAFREGGAYLVALEPDVFRDLTWVPDEGPVLGEAVQADLSLLGMATWEWAVFDPQGPIVARLFEDGVRVHESVPSLEGLPPIERVIVVEIGGDPVEVVGRLEDAAWVSWAEPVARYEVASSGEAVQAEVPGGGGAPAAAQAAGTVELLAYQWNLASLQMPAALQIAAGRGIPVAVLDSGVEVHRDGFRNLATGKCLDLIELGGTCRDPLGHGTHTAGVIAATPANGIGIDGLAPDVELVPVRIADADGVALSHDLAAGIVHAVAQGARVVHIGVAGYLPSRLVREALAWAERQGALVVAPAGNQAYTRAVAFPASEPTVLGVGSVDMSGRVSAFSNVGDRVDVYAPGGDLTVDDDVDSVVDGILAESPHQGGWAFTVREGTSFAAAHVSAVAALSLSLPDVTLSPPLLRDVIRTRVDPAHPLPELELDVLRGGIVSPLSTLQTLAEEERGQAAVGAACFQHGDCATGVCEGQGCGRDAPGTCASTDRSCTIDLQPLCSCDGRTVYASSTCPHMRFEAAGPCDL